jgi:hypothetical protein
MKVTGWTISWKQERQIALLLFKGSIIVAAGTVGLEDYIHGTRYSQTSSSCR